MNDTEERIKTIEARIKELYATQKAVVEERVKLQDELTTLRDSTFNFDPLTFTPEQFINYPEDHYSYETYKKVSNWFDSRYVGKGLYRDGREVKTQQKYLKVMLTKSRPLEEQLGILEFLPLMKYDSVGIFESSLSSGGIWRIQDIHSDQCKVMKTYYSRDQDPVFTGSLIDCLKYVHQHLYYQK